MLKALARDGFILPLQPHMPTSANFTAFLRPKSSEKAAFIADLRPLNQLSPNPLPHFSLPSLLHIADLIASFPPSTLWATAIDITNFFWSLLLPVEAHGAFRIGGFFLPCLPFGWNLSPILAQETLTFLIKQSLQIHSLTDSLDTSLWIFHYYDDILILSTQSSLAQQCTQAIVNHLQHQHLLISPKSLLIPTQNITWLGKLFDLRERLISNTDKVATHTLALCLTSLLAPVHKKSIERLLGYLLWAFRPHRGATLFLRSWYLHLHSRRRFQRWPSTGMSAGLLDALALSLRAWSAPTTPSLPLFTPIICMDAALVSNHYQIGLYSPTFGARILIAPPEITTQQQAELFAADAALRLSVRLGFPHVTLIGDNSGSLYSLESLRGILAAQQWIRILRRITNRLLWSGLCVHLLWVPSALQPADPISRAKHTNLSNCQNALRTAHQKWSTLWHCSSCLRSFGFLAL